MQHIKTQQTDVDCHFYKRIKNSIKCDVLFVKNYLFQWTVLSQKLCYKNKRTAQNPTVQAICCLERNASGQENLFTKHGDLASCAFRTSGISSRNRPRTSIHFKSRNLKNEGLCQVLILQKIDLQNLSSQIIQHSMSLFCVSSGKNNTVRTVILSVIIRCKCHLI